MACLSDEVGEHDPDLSRRSHTAAPVPNVHAGLSLEPFSISYLKLEPHAVPITVATARSVPA